MIAALGVSSSGSVTAQAAPVSFAQSPAPPAPDYSKTEAWTPLAGAVPIVAPGATPAAASPAIDIFYIHPTTDRSMDHWNADIANGALNAWTDASVVARQSGIFNACCRVFAPRYRQASFLALMNMKGDGSKAFDLAYGDVERAFDAFMAASEGRPFILAGHSQGAFHLARLLERKIDGTPLVARLVAAYVIGVNLSEGEFGKTYKTISICDTPDQTGCVVAWNAVLPESNRAATAALAEQRYIERYGDDPGKTILCINPLTFDRARPDADADKSQGAVPGAPGWGGLQRLRANGVKARCDKGALIVEPDAVLDLQPLPGGSMHYHDLGLFYADVRANAMLRAAAFLKMRGRKH
ncbi:DUF3089 domain-containing protein [Sphingobium boeckii]|uniref:Pimeloyl-ACP methyl ester carboxylesterase n=1 Tax=Sphingobium boeckii TaxID=1082345 RepID=A0A7W9AJ28_9SPHN|nr:DUF3089 domain-containing protein [Sphingobium boeckii]MBB5686386.1 pimeloyl-ACP methyl ester carboxylesterase [Sphingobium boeckii]